MSQPEITKWEGCTQLTSVCQPHPTDTGSSDVQSENFFGLVISFSFNCLPFHDPFFIWFCVVMRLSERIRRLRDHLRLSRKDTHNRSNLTLLSMKWRALALSSALTNSTLISA